MSTDYSDHRIFVVDLGQQYLRVGNSGDNCPCFKSLSLAGFSHSDKDVSMEQQSSSTSNDLTNKLNNKYRSPIYFSSLIKNLEIKHCLYQPSRCTNKMNSELLNIEDVTNPLEPLVLDSDVFESLINTAFGKHHGMSVNLKDKYLLLSEPTIHNRTIRRQMAELFFEQFQIESLYMAKKATLATFAVGQSSALVVDIGSTHTIVTPVDNGYTLQKCIKHLPVGGDLIDYQLSCMLKWNELQSSIMPVYCVKKNVQLQQNLPPLITSIDKVPILDYHPSYYNQNIHEVIKDIKESIAFVSEIPITADNKEVISLFTNNIKVAPSNTSSLADVEDKYALPDGTLIHTSKIGDILSECLFQFNWIFHSNKRDLTYFDSPLPDSFQGYKTLSELVIKTILNTDMDIQSDLYKSIVVTGGCSLISRFSNRLNNDILKSNIVPSYLENPHIISPGSKITKEHLTWIGGSILSSLRNFYNMWMSKEDYSEYGLNLLETKFL